MRSSLPLCSICRERESIQTLWPSSLSSWSLDLAIGGLPFHLFDLLKPLDVTLAAVEAGREEGSRQLGGHFGADDLGAEAEHVHVVVLDALVRGIGVVADRCADARDLVGRDRRDDARAADEQRSLGLAAADRLGDLTRLVGVVDPRLRLVGAQIDRLVPERPQLLQQPLAQVDAAVVEGDGDSHRTVTLPRMEGPELWRELGQQLRVDS